MSRAWFIYNGDPGDEQDAGNYFYIPFFPVCQTTGDEICAVLGIYDPETYGPFPVPFSLDTNLESYIIDALASDVAQPSGLFQKPYVYVRFAT